MSSRVVIPVLESLEQNEKPLVKQVLKGVKQIQHQRIASQSHSTTQTTFNFQPPSQNTVIDRRFELEMDVDFDCSTANGLHQTNNNSLATNGTDAGALGANVQTVNVPRSKFRAPTTQTQLLPSLTAVGASTAPASNSPADIKTAVDAVITNINTELTTALSDQAKSFVAGDLGTRGIQVAVGNNFAPRQFPLTSCMESIDLVINGTHFSVSVNQYIHAVMSYTTSEWREKNLPATPHAPDITSNFSDEQVVGNARNPLSLIGESFKDGEEPRGAILSKVNFSGGNKATFSFREPLFISPLMAMLGHGLTNVNQLDITIRWSASPQSAMFNYFPLSVLACGDNGEELFPNPAAPNPAIYPAIDTMSATWGTGNLSQAFMNVLYYTPQDDVNIPNEIVLPYKQPQIELFNATQGLNGTANCSNVRLNQIPESVFLYVRQRNSKIGLDKTMTQGRITGVNIKWKNQTGILSGYEEKDLIELACYNGYDSNVAEVLNGRGLVLKLNYGQDIPLDDNESPGTRGDYNWQVDITYADVPSNGTGTEDVVAYQIFVLNGHAIISPNECRVSTGVLSLEDNMNAEDLGHSYQADDASVAGGSFVGGSAVGGSLIGGYGQHLRKVAKIAHHGRKAVEAAAPEVKEMVKAYQSRA